MKTKVSALRFATATLGVAAMLAIAGCSTADGGSTGDLESMEPVTIRYASNTNETDSVGIAIKAFADEVTENSGGKIQFEYFWASSLLTGEEALSGIQNGLADMTSQGYTYNPEELQVGNWLGGLASLVSAPFPHGLVEGNAGFHDAAVNWPELQEEFSKYNAKVLTSHYVPSYDLLCKDAVGSLSDLEGLRVRTAGTIWNEEVQALGMIPVPMPAGEIFEGLQRGVVDCVTFPVWAFGAFGLWDVAKNFVQIPLTGSSGALTLRQDLFDSLPAEAQQVILDAVPTYVTTRLEAEIGGLTGIFTPEGAGADAVVSDASEIEAALVAFQQERVAQFVADAPASITDPQGRIDEFEAVLDRWHAILVDELGIPVAEPVPGVAPYQFDEANQQLVYDRIRAELG